MNDGVGGNVRGKAIDAAIQLVGRRGYGAISLEEILSVAGLTRAEFELVFADKTACWLAAQEELADELFARVKRAFVAPGTFAERAAAALGTLTRALAHMPRLTKAATVQLAAMGRAGEARRAATIEPYADLLDEARVGSNYGVAVPESIALLAVGAVATMIFDEVLAGRGADLESKTSELLFALLLPLNAGPVEARAELQRIGLGTT